MITPFTPHELTLIYNYIGFDENGSRQRIGTDIGGMVFIIHKEPNMNIYSIGADDWKIYFAFSKNGIVARIDPTRKPQVNSSYSYLYVGPSQAFSGIPRQTHITGDMTAIQRGAMVLKMHEHLWND